MGEFSVAKYEYDEQMCNFAKIKAACEYDIQGIEA